MGTNGIGHVHCDESQIWWVIGLKRLVKTEDRPGDQLLLYADGGPANEALHVHYYPLRLLINAVSASTVKHLQYVWSDEQHGGEKRGNIIANAAAQQEAPAWLPQSILL